MSVMAHVELPAKGTVTLAFVTSVARSRSGALTLAQKYGSMHSVRWAFRDAEQESPRRLQRARVAPDLLPSVQRLFSAMLFADPALRAPAEVRATTPACQERLWGRGISGDDPIVLVNVHAPESQFLQDVLAAQRFLRACGVRMDLVLIDQQPSGYATELAGTLRGVLRQSDALDWLNRHGGIFVIAADQAPPSELRHLEACARVVLSTQDVSLASRLDRPVDAPAALPRFEATLAADREDRRPPRPKLIFDNGIGGFTEDGREYVLEVGPGAQAPAPWCNVLANP
jgi:cyclic beta-1,2-glucan synthetase